VAELPLGDLLARRERERLEADRLYNDALTAVDQALPVPVSLPDEPPPVDQSRLADINRSWGLGANGAPVADRSFTGRLRKLIWRLIDPSYESQRQFSVAVVDHLNRNAENHRELTRIVVALREAVGHESEALTRFASLLVQYLQTITVYVDSKDRSLAGTDLRSRLALAEQRLLALKRTVELSGPGQQSEPGNPRQTPGELFGGRVDSLTYVGFEDAFRGSREAISRRIEDYMPLLEPVEDVVDVGCGRGEVLDALRSRGIRARGVDVNHAMVELCRSRGLTVAHGDALSYLEAQDDGSIGGLVAIQVVEHFEPAYLLRFLETAHRKMRPGAPLVLETINPACWLAFFEAYIRDLTHVRPLHPDTLKYLAQASGFDHADIHYRRPVPEKDRLARVAVPSGPTVTREINQLAEALNAHADKLNARLFSDTDYALVARR
jgi:SAM-dependent methyltransferase